eukprot:6354872-Pyramimonas_sp.AAC.1
MMLAAGECRLLACFACGSDLSGRHATPSPRRRGCAPRCRNVPTHRDCPHLARPRFHLAATSASLDQPLFIQ